MPTEKALARIERLTWVLIYLGLFALVLGLAGLSHRAAVASSWSLVIVGGLLAATGATLIWVRSRLEEPSGGLRPGNAQSKPDPREGTE
jgi:hypothetical protein